MTLEMLFEVVRGIVHSDYNISVGYAYRSWAEPQYTVTVTSNGKNGGTWNHESPKALLKEYITEILKCAEAPK